MFLLLLASVLAEVQEDEDVCLLQTRFLDHREWLSTDSTFEDEDLELRMNSSSLEARSEESATGDPFPRDCAFAGSRRRWGGCSCRRRNGGEMGTTCNAYWRLECAAGKEYDATQGACVDIIPPTEPPCNDDVSWTDQYGDGCDWYLANDPGCAVYADTGQKTHCNAACGICGSVTAPAHVDDTKCATTYDIQSICGKPQQYCSGSGCWGSRGPCRMNDCSAYMSVVSWGSWDTYGLKDGQAMGTGYGYEVKQHWQKWNHWQQYFCITNGQLVVCPTGFDCDTNNLIDKTAPTPTPAPTGAPTPAPTTVNDADPLLWPTFGYGEKCDASAGVPVDSAWECQQAAAVVNHSYYSFLSTTKHCFTNEECQAPVATDHPWVVYMRPWPEIKFMGKCDESVGHEYNSQGACQLAALSAGHHYYSWKKTPGGKWLSLTDLDATQSSTLPGDGASNALDGDESTCSNTDAWTADNGHAWWKVDLPESHDVFSVRVTNTNDVNQMLGIQIYIDGFRCAHHVTAISGTVDIPCEGRGKELRIEREGGNLALCEVALGIVAGACFTSDICHDPLDTDHNWTIHENPQIPPDPDDWDFDFFVQSAFIPKNEIPQLPQLGADTPPCPGDAVVTEADVGVCAASAVSIQNPYEDNVAMASVTYHVQGKGCNATAAECPFHEIADISAHVFQVGHTVVGVIGEDTSSHKSMCKMDVYVYDEQPPVFKTPPSNVDPTMALKVSNTTCYIQDMEPFREYESLGWEPEATDNCDQDVRVVRRLYSPDKTLLFDEWNPANGVHGPQSLVMAYEAHDDFSDSLALPEKRIHTTVHQVGLTLFDDTPPTTIVGCPEDIHIEVEPTETEAVVSWTPPHATGDNCDNDEALTAEEMSTPQKVPGMTLPVGVHTATYSFSDTSGKTMAEGCTFHIEIKQRQNEVNITCPEDVELETLTHAHFNIATWAEPLATRNGEPDATIVSYPQGVASGMPFPFGWTHVTVHANHSSASAECVFAVTVRDPQSPEPQGSSYRCAAGAPGVEPYGICGGPELTIRTHDTYEDTFGYEIEGVSQVTQSCCRSEDEVAHICTSLANTGTKYCLPRD